MHHCNIVSNILRKKTSLKQNLALMFIAVFGGGGGIGWCPSSWIYWIRHWIVKAWNRFNLDFRVIVFQFSTIFHFLLKWVWDKHTFSQSSYNLPFWQLMYEINPCQRERLKIISPIRRINTQIHCRLKHTSSPFDPIMTTNNITLPGNLSLIITSKRQEFAPEPVADPRFSRRGRDNLRVGAPAHYLEKFDQEIWLKRGHS